MKIIKSLILITLPPLGFFLSFGLYSQNAFSQIAQDILKSIPSDAIYISFIDVKNFLASPFFLKSKQGQTALGQISSDLASVIEKTGVDLESDISSLLTVKLARTAITLDQGSLIVATGKFNKDKILSYIHGKKLNCPEKKYKSIILITTLKKDGDWDSQGIALLTDTDVAIGYIHALKAFIDTRMGIYANILSNLAMVSLIKPSFSNEILWFAGRYAHVVDKAPIPVPLGSLHRSIQAISGAFNLIDNVSGNISITAINQNAATNIMDFYKRLAATGPELGDESAALKLLERGLVAVQNGSQVNLTLSYSFDTALKIWNWSCLPFNSSPKNNLNPANKTIGPSTNNYVEPFVLFWTLPSYTQEAKKAKIEGLTRIELLIHRDGRSECIKVLKGLGYGLDEEAIKTIESKWRFIPGTLNGEPVDFQGFIVEVNFRLY
jgi:TonB family protein